MMSKSNLQVSQSDGSCATSSGIVRGRVEIAPPKNCWCGASVVELKSKSIRNPDRMYYRCSYAANNRVMNDGHFFKWADELPGAKAKTLENEVVEIKQLITESFEFERKKLDEREERLIERISKALEDEVVEMKQMIAEIERKKLEEIEIEVEERLTERIEVAIVEAKRRICKVMGIVVISWLVIIVVSAKLFG